MISPSDFSHFTFAQLKTLNLDDAEMDMILGHRVRIQNKAEEERKLNGMKFKEGDLIRIRMSLWPWKSASYGRITKVIYTEEVGLFGMRKNERYNIQPHHNEKETCYPVARLKMDKELMLEHNMTGEGQ